MAAEPLFDFDHLALATDDAEAALNLLVGELGATYLFGHTGRGFRWGVVRLGTATAGLNLELLEPWQPEQDDFLARFLARRGPGPHHLTFKSPDLDSALSHLCQAGLTPTGVSLADPRWREAFISPRDALGTVIQVGQLGVPRPAMAQVLQDAHSGRAQARLESYAAIAEGDPWWPRCPARSPRPAIGIRVVLAIPSLPRALSLFRDTLQGAVVAEGPTWSELRWKGPCTLRLEQRTDLPQGIAHVEYTSPIASGDLRIAGALFRKHAPGQRPPDVA